MTAQLRRVAVDCGTITPMIDFKQGMPRLRQGQTPGCQLDALGGNAIALVKLEDKEPGGKGELIA